jgi:hypothetical protein
VRLGPITKKVSKVLEVSAKRSYERPVFLKGKERERERERESVREVRGGRLFLSSLVLSFKDILKAYESFEDERV